MAFCYIAFVRMGMCSQEGRDAPKTTFYCCCDKPGRPVGGGEVVRGDGGMTEGRLFTRQTVSVNVQTLISAGFL